MATQVNSLTVALPISLTKFSLSRTELRQFLDVKFISLYHSLVNISHKFERNFGNFCRRPIHKLTSNLLVVRQLGYFISFPLKIKPPCFYDHTLFTSLRAEAAELLTLGKLLAIYTHVHPTTWAFLLSQEKDTLIPN